MQTRIWPGTILSIVLVIATSIAMACSSASTSPTPRGPKFSTPITIAIGQTIGTSTYASGDSVSGGTGQPVQGIACDASTPVQHIHAHLTLIANGVQRAIPLAVGVKDAIVIQSFVVAAGCYYWIHTHDATGIIHVEAPASNPFTLGQFFAIWGQSLTRTNIGGFSGAVTAYVDSTKYDGDLSALDFQAHQQITLIVGTVPDTIPIYALPAVF